MLSIIPGDFDDPRVRRLLHYHFTTCHAVTPAGSAHSLDFSGFQIPNISFWTVWESDCLRGMGALKRLSIDHGEVKSMHTVAEARGRGLGHAMLDHLIEQAQMLGMSRLSLETGSFDFFRPAVSLYKSRGFVECEPFADYKPDPNSVFLTRLL